jgi:NAD(P)-dependent dehydrogenase (short-subunit alcohol dehydrogenase family)
MGSALTQLFPPRPSFIEANLPSLTGKVYIITGGNSGIGYALSKILYAAGGTVYIASRSASKIEKAIETIKTSTTSPTTGVLKPLILDLADLSTIAPAVSEFLKAEKRLDVLFNNAGVSRQPAGSVTAQGHEMHMGTNNLGPFLLTKLLLPLLTQTAASSPPNSVRVIWTSSAIIDLASPPGGLLLAELEPGRHSRDLNRNYASSKAGNWFLASELSNRFGKEKEVVSVALSPGTLRTPAWDGAGWVMKLLMAPFFHEPEMGALTLLWVGFSDEVKVGDGGKYGIPWGRWNESPKKEHLDSLKSKGEGGTGLAGEFWEYCEVHTKDFVG